jgi:hypothetical protein
MQGHHYPVGPPSHLPLQGNMAAALAKFDESRAFQGADESFSRYARKLHHSTSNFDKRPEWQLRWIGIGTAPCFEVQLDRFAKIGPSRLHILTLRSHAEFRAARNVPLRFFRDEGGKAVSHGNMLANTDG